MTTLLGIDGIVYHKRESTKFTDYGEEANTPRDTINSNIVH